MAGLRMQRHYRGTIWTNHALERLRARGISQGDAWATWRNPDSTRYAASRGGWVRGRTYGKNRIEVVTKQNERGEWVILSVWSKAVYGVRARRRPVNLFVRIIRYFLFGTW